MKYMSVTLTGNAPNDGERLVQLEDVVKIAVSATAVTLTYDGGTTAALAFASANAAAQKVIVDKVIAIQKEAINDGVDAAGVIAYSAAQPAAGFTGIS